MAHYSIKDLERLSGIHAHTIRIWEKRYQLVKPERTNTNIRVYSDNDLKRLLNVALLNKNGLKISKIARLSENDLTDKIIRLSEDYSNIDNQIENLVVAMIDLDEVKFENLLNTIIKTVGFEKAITEVVYPFLVKIGVLWQTGNISPAQEHFVSNIIRRKLNVAIDNLGPSNISNDKKIILFLPEGEFHEISLLFYAYISKKSGFYPIYLGQSVPLNDIISVQETYKANYLFVCFTTALQDFSILDYISLISKKFKKAKIFISGSQVIAFDIKKGSNLIKIKSPEHFTEQISRLK
jgi:DNA-binding transcriptional MerR regulator